MRPLRATVVGCGTAGAAAALLLARAGHEVHLFERFADPQPIGAGLLLQPTGLAVLARLGLRERVEAAGDRITRIVGRTTGGRGVLDLDYGDLRPGLAGVGIHRAELFGALWDALARQPGVTVHTGVEVTELDGLDADLVVVAAGARTPLRAALGIPHRARPYPWGALWCIAPDPRRAFSGALQQVYRDTRGLLGFLPTGGEVSLFWSVPAGTPPPDDLDAFAARLGALDPRAIDVLAHIRGPHDLLPATYLDVRMPRWHAGRTVLLGDAGHAMSPQLGQGANLALMDAAALADALADAPDVPTALGRYSDRRRAHLRYYARASRGLTPVFQSHLALLGPPRDLLMGPLGRVGFVRRPMLQTLVGVKTGVWRSMELPP